MGMKFKSLACHLGILPDPRKAKGQRHLLLDILVIAVLATLCGVDDWEGIEQFGKFQEGWLRTFLALPNGIPSHDTFNRVFRLLDPRAFRDAFLAWVRGIREKVPGDLVALDGKALRGTLEQGEPALHVVSAWSEANGMVLGQRAVDEKSNETKAIPELIKVLDLRGCIVTIDAAGCQKDIAKGIVAKKADYILAVKANQGRLHQAIKEAFSQLDQDAEATPHFIAETQEAGHGRKEGRKTTTLNALKHLQDDLLFSWPKLESLVRVQSETTRRGKDTVEERFYISTLPPAQAPRIAKGVRSHWGIENRLHWVLDVAFREDANRTRKGSAPECGAILRHIALNLLRQDPFPGKWSIRSRRLRAALNADYRLVALLGFPQGPFYKPEPEQPRPRTYTPLKGNVPPIHPLLRGE